MPPADVNVPQADQELPTLKNGSASSGLRNPDIEEASNRLFIHRLSMALIPFFIRTRITPNMVSCLGALCGLIAAFFYYNYESTAACVCGFAFMIGWHVFDGADGQLARQTGQCSPIGFVIDGVCDYVTYISVYVALALSLSITLGNEVWFLVVGAGACHALQAAAFEMQREHYIHWATHGTPQTTSACQVETRSAVSAVGSLVERGYRFIQELFRPLTFKMETEIAVMIDQGTEPMAIATAYKTNFRKVVLRWSFLSANNRTLAIFVFCFAGYPLGYFIYEVGLLTLVLLGLFGINARARAAFMASLTLPNTQTP